jgi:hypothetical protein
VQTVTLISPTKAAVGYTILLRGAPVLPGQKGTAVYQGGVWKVSAASFCSVVKLGANGQKIPGCS